MTSTTIERVLNRLETSLNASSKISKNVTITRLDDTILDALFELDQILTDKNILSTLNRTTHQSQLLKLILDKVVRRCGETVLSRNLVCSCLIQLVEANTGCMQLVHHECMTLLQHKEQSPRLAGLAMLSSLVSKYGLQFLTNPAEIINILVKLSKRDECVCKELVLQSTGAIYVGTLGGRTVDQASATECLKLVARFADRSNEKSLRIMSAHCMEQVITSSVDAREVDIVMPLVIKALLDPDIEVRLAHARAMGTILYQTQLKDAARAADPKGRRRLAYDVRSINDALELIAKLFAKAPGSTLRTSLSMSVVQLMQHGCKECDDSAASGYVMSLIGLVFKPRGVDCEREGRQLAACLSDAIHRGILDQRSERGLEIIIKSVVSALKHTSEAELNEYQIVVACECLSTCFIRLGESIDGLELKDAALDALLSLLASPIEALRIHASQCLRILAGSCHSHIATWLSVIEKMIGIVWSDLLEGRGRSANESHALDPWHALHGHVSALTAVVGVVTECERGVSISMIESIFAISRKFINHGSLPDDHTTYASQYCSTAKIQQAGWLLLAALIGLGSEFVSPRLNLLFGMWRGVLGRQPPSTPQHVADIADDLSVRAAALTSLRSYMHVMRHRMVLTVGNGQSLAQSMSPVLKACRVFLATNLNLVKALASAKDLEPVIVQGLHAIKPPLYDCFAAIPPTCYSSFFSRLLKLIVAEFASQPISTANTELYRLLNPSDACLQWPPSADLSLLRFLDLQADSDSNQPGVSTNSVDFLMNYGSEPRCAGGSIECNYLFDWFVRPDSHTLAQINVQEVNHSTQDDSVPAVQTSSNSVVSLPDGTNRNHHVSYSATNNSDLVGSHSPECYQNNVTRSINAAVRLFSCLFADQSPAYKEQLMKHLLALVQKSRAAVGSSPVLDSPIMVNIATCLLGVCRDQCLRKSAVNAQQAVHLMLSIAVDLLSSTNALVQRAAAESIGLIVQFEDEEPSPEQSTVQSQPSMLVKVMSVLRQQTASKDPNVLCGAVFALGCVHRYGGGLKTVREMTLSVASLHTIARDFVQPLRLYCLHALWLIVDSGGLSFASAAQPTLAMLWAHSIHDTDQQRPHLVSFALSRIIVSVIAALGPDVNPELSSHGSNAALGVERFANIEHHLMNTDNELVQSALIEAQNERVLFNAVLSYDKLATMLSDGLNGSHPIVQLRRAAAKCVLRWGEKDVCVITRHRFDRLLLNAIDVELDPSTRALLEHALRSLIVLHGTKNVDMSTPSHSDSEVSRTQMKAGPKPVRFYLFESLKRVVGTGSQANMSSSSGAHPNNEPAADDEDESIVVGKTSSVGPSTVASTDTATSAQLAECHWQTKSFALSCLSLLLRECRSSLPNTEFDLAYARRHRKFQYEYVIDQLVDLLTLACSATSAMSDCLRLAGVNMAVAIVECYSTVVDPDSDVDSLRNGTSSNNPENSAAEPLLSLYAAQINSALSSALKNRSESIGSAPAIRLKGCVLAVALLRSAVVHDPIVVQRFVKQILLPLQKPSDVAVWYAQYDGNAVTSVLLAHLSAIGQLQLACTQSSTSTDVHITTKKKKHRPSTRMLAMQSIDDALSPHTDFIQDQLISALRDFLRLLITARKDLSRARGTFFDGSTATRVIESFSPYWHTILDAATYNQLRHPVLSSAEPELPTSSHPLICLAVASSHLLTCFGSEIAGFNRNRNGVTGIKELAEREEMQTLTCLDVIASVARLCLSQSDDTPSNQSAVHMFVAHTDIVMEVVLALQWALQHRPNEDQSVIRTRQRRAAHALNELVQAMLVSEAFRSEVSQELLLVLLNCVFVCLCQHTAAIHGLSSHLVLELLDIMPLVVHLACETFIRSSPISNQDNEVSCSLIINCVLTHCERLLHHSAIEIAQKACDSFVRTVHLMYVYADKVPELAVDETITAHVHQEMCKAQYNLSSRVDGGVESDGKLGVEHIVNELQVVWALAIYHPTVNTGEADLLTGDYHLSVDHGLLDQVISAVVHTLESSSTLDAAFRFVETCLFSSSDSIPTCANFVPSVCYAVSRIFPILMQRMDDDHNNDHLVKVAELLLSVCRTVPDSTKVLLLSIVLPVIINRLQECPDLLSRITDFAGSDSELFKQAVLLLPNVTKVSLQAAVIKQPQPTETSVPVAKGKKKKRDNGSTSVNDTIELKTDFTAFSKR